MSSGKIISMVAVGAAVGAGIGYLFLTDSGKKHMKKVTNSTGEYSDKFKDGIATFLFAMIEKLTAKKASSNGEAEETDRDAAANIPVGSM